MKKQLLFLFLALALSAVNQLPAQNIYTYAGNGMAASTGDGGSALAASVFYPMAVAVDRHGNTYVSSWSDARIRKIDTSGIITTFAGTGVEGYSGDGGPATSAKLYRPFAITTDLFGNVYFVDFFNDRIRKVNPSGIITTVAGTGVEGFSGDGAAATLAQIKKPFGLATDRAGALYIADYDNHRIRKINTAGIITTLAGNGTQGYSGDGGPATAAVLNFPRSIAVDTSGNIFFSNGYRISRIDAVSGIITTYAGTGGAGSGGDGGPATLAQLDPYDITIDLNGNIYVAHRTANKIRKIDVAGIITTIGGSGAVGSAGDGGPAINAELAWPSSVAVDPYFTVYFGDENNHKVRIICQMSCTTGIDGQEEDKELVRLFPNPSSGSFHLVVAQGLANAELRLFNFTGQKVFSQKVASGENIISTTALAKGLYGYTIITNDKKALSGKIIVE